MSKSSHFRTTCQLDQMKCYQGRRDKVIVARKILRVISNCLSTFGHSHTKEGFAKGSIIKQ